MFEVRLHGLTGQGVLATAELLAIAASLEGRHAQALPGFGATRAVGEVVAFCRIDDHEISTQEPVTRPDAMIVDALPDQWVPAPRMVASATSGRVEITTASTPPGIDLRSW